MVPTSVTSYKVIQVEVVIMIVIVAITVLLFVIDISLSIFQYPAVFADAPLDAVTQTTLLENAGCGFP